MNFDLQAYGLKETIRNMAEMPGLYKQARKSAMKSVGYEVQQELKSYGKMARQHTAGPWPRLHAATPRIKSAKRKPITARQRRYKRGPRKGQVVPKYRTRSGSMNTSNPMARLVNAPRYRVNSQGTAVQVGFYGTPASLVAKHEDPYTVRVTPKMRRFFWALSLPLAKETKTLRIPERPLFSPVRDKMVPRLGDIFEDKFLRALERRGVDIEGI